MEAPMPQPLAHDHPYDLAHARAVLTTPALHRADPLVIFQHWRFLKEARGQAARLGRLGQTHHMIAQPAYGRLNLVPTPDSAPAAPSPRRPLPAAPAQPEPAHADDGTEGLWLAELSPAPMPPASQRTPIPEARPGLAGWFAKRLRGEV
jgi:hypothetical protein